MKTTDICLVSGETNETLFVDMFVLYCKELSKYMDSSIDNPRLIYKDLYHNDNRLHKYFIMHKGHIAGFAIIQPINEHYHIGNYSWYLAEFYICPKYRNKHIGIDAFSCCLNTFGKDLFMYILKKNKAAKEFWNKAIKTNHLEIYPPFAPSESDECDLICLHEAHETDM